jgi:large subunit ribosomal protein L3
MTRVFREGGKSVPVTVLEAEPCPVVQVKTPESDGYDAVQIGYSPQKESRLSRPMAGHLAKAGTAAVARLKEVPAPAGEEVKEGDTLDVTMFEEGELVDVTGYSKGRGFQGVVKRHGFSGGDESHGNKSKRVPGAIGQCATPSRVYKNRRMPGRHGGRKVTVRNLEVIEVDPDNNLLVVKGAVPGSKNGYLLVRKNSRGRA